MVSDSSALFTIECLLFCQVYLVEQLQTVIRLYTIVLLNIGPESSYLVYDKSERKQKQNNNFSMYIHVRTQ